MTMQNPQSSRPAATLPRLVRAFVRSSDPRCPLVAVWTLADPAAADDPSLFRPAMERFRRFWRAIHFPIACIA